MSFDPIDLAGLHHLPWTQPAPTSSGDPDQYPHTPWRPRVVAKACGCGVLAGESCDCQELAAQHERQLDKAIWFGRRAA